MSAFVILALVLAVMIIGVVVVTVRELLRNLRKLNAQIRATNERLTPLTDELQAELAVTSLEVDGLTAGVERLQAERAARARQAKARNLGRKRRRSRRKP